MANPSDLSNSPDDPKWRAPGDLGVPPEPNSRAAITKFLFIRDQPTPVDLAFVLGAPSVRNVEPAIHLYHQNFTDQILISGLGPHGSSQPMPLAEAQVLKNYAVRCGVPAAKILLELNATNTMENFSFSHDVIQQHLGWDGIRSVAICGKPFQMRRALMTARAHWPPHLHLVMLPSDHPDDPNAQTWWQSPTGRSYVFKELNAISIYAMKGDIGDF